MMEPFSECTWNALRSWWMTSPLSSLVLSCCALLLRFMAARRLRERETKLSWSATFILLLILREGLSLFTSETSFYLLSFSSNATRSLLFEHSFTQEHLLLASFAQSFVCTFELEILTFLSAAQTFSIRPNIEMPPGKSFQWQPRRCYCSLFTIVL